jgi:hypothetical protein
LTKSDFGNILLSAVDEELSSLGESSKQAIFFHLEASFQIKKESIPRNLAEFRKALEGIFGPGASYLEKGIAKRLHEKLGLELEDCEYVNFLRCVNTARKRINPRKDCVTK